MVGAVIELKSWLGTNQYFVQGENPFEIMIEFEKKQDLHCLARMGRQHETTKKGQKELDKLDDFLDKYDSQELTLSEIKEFAYELEVGSFKCLGIADGEDEIQKLKNDFPEAKQSLF